MGRRVHALLVACALCFICGRTGAAPDAGTPPDRAEPEPQLLVALSQDCKTCVKPLHPLRIHVETNGAVQSFGRGAPMHWYPLQPEQLQRLRALMSRPEWRTLVPQPSAPDETQLDVRTASGEVEGARGPLVQQLAELLHAWDRQNRQPENPAPILRRFSRCDNCFVGIYQDVSVLADGRVRFREHGKLALAPRVAPAKLQALQALLRGKRWQELPPHRVGRYDEEERYLEAGGRRVSDFTDPLVIEVVKLLDAIEAAAPPPRWW